MKFLSLCSGIEAASVAWYPIGFECVGVAEIEPFPSAVLAHHYPAVPNYGDISKFMDWPDEMFEQVDIIVGGPPCQSFSIAGLRRGLDDERGNLTLTYVRIIDHADRLRLRAGKPPVICVYENVPGILSDKTNAFGNLLGGLAGEDVQLEPSGKRWTDAGCVSGPERAIAWRIQDAQYHGLPQRRRRVFVVASARDGFDPAAVLLEFEGVRRDTAPRRETGQVAAHATAPYLTSSGRGVERTGDTRGQDPVVACKWPAEVTGTLDAHFGDKQGLEDQHVNAGCPLFVPAARDTISTLTARGPYSLGIPEVDGGQIIPTTISALTASMGVGSYLGHNKDDKVIVTHTLKGEGFDASEDGTGRGTPLVPVISDAVGFYANEGTHGSGQNVEMSPTLKAHPKTSNLAAVAYSIMPQNSGRDYKAREVEVAQPIMAGGPVGGNQGGDYIMQLVAVPLQEVGKRTGASTTDPRAGIGIGQDGDPMFTLQAGAQHGVAAYGFQPRIARNGRGDMGDLVNALNAQSGETGKGDAAPCVAVAMRESGQGWWMQDDVAGTLRAEGEDRPSRPSHVIQQPLMAVRRLTPTECSRLQGFPDDYLLQVTFRGKCPPPDGPMYKALGNSMAVPCMRWIGKRIAAHTPNTSASSHSGTQPDSGVSAEPRQT